MVERLSYKAVSAIALPQVFVGCGNGGKVFWKMIGYPGLPATLARDMVEFRDKRRSRPKRLRPRIMGSRRVLHAPRFVLTGESKGRNLIRRCRLNT